MAADCSLAILDLEHFLSVGHLVEAEFLSHLGTHLGCIAIDGLATSEHDVNMADFLVDLLNGLGQKIRGGEGVCARAFAVGKQPAAVCTAVESLTDDLSSTRRTHGDDAHLDVLRVEIFDAESLLQGVQVFRIEDGGKITNILLLDQTKCIKTANNLHNW